MPNRSLVPILDLFNCLLSSKRTHTMCQGSLNIMVEEHHQQKSTTKVEYSAKLQLSVIVVGSGIGGLSAALACAQAGHKVLVLESAQQISEVGAGIQVPPNLSRLLQRWKLLDSLNTSSVPILHNSLRRWENDEELGIVPLNSKVEKIYGSPLLVAHRGDLQQVLLDGAIKAGAQIKTCSRVAKTCFTNSPSVTLVDGTVYNADVILAADGFKSTIRGQMMSKKGTQMHQIKPTGDSAYRVLIPRAKLQHDPDLVKLLDQPVGMRWMGPGCHIMAYPIRSHALYNMVLLHPDREGSEISESWTNHGSKTEMVATYKGWNETVRKLLDLVPEGNILEWRLSDHDSLPSWVEGNCALLGDACHPMLPYVAQGAAQAVEDAAVLSTVLSLISKKDEIHSALKVYEKVRKERGELIQRSAATTRIALHLPDGPEQRERDEKIKLANDMGNKNPDLWGDDEWQRFMWGVDVQKNTIDNWQSLIDSVTTPRQQG